MKPYWEDTKRGLQIYCGDNRTICPSLTGISAVVTDPPYHLTSGKNSSGGFMGKKWDGGDIAFRPETWSTIAACCLPGAHMVAFGGCRTYHRLVCAIEDAGWQPRNSIAWLFGQGFPKSLNVAKSIEKSNGIESEIIGEHKGTEFGMNKTRCEQGYRPTVSKMSGHITAPVSKDGKKWDGWGTDLKPAMELVCLSRKPLGEKTVAANVLRYGTGGLNIDASRISTDSPYTRKGTGRPNPAAAGYCRPNASMFTTKGDFVSPPKGRFPANVILSHSPGCSDAGCEPDCAVRLLDEQSGQLTSGKPCGTKHATNNIFGEYGTGIPVTGIGDTGGASRFFKCCEPDTEQALRFLYTAKASGSDRGNRVKGALPLFGVEEEEFRNSHPTVKPLSIMKYLIKLICPPVGIVLDPFMGSGSTLVACKMLGFPAIGIELDDASCQIAVERLESASAP